MSAAEGNYFDQVAAQWDDSPVRQGVAAAVVRELQAHAGLTPRIRALEFGCGSGLVTIRILPEVGHLIAVDTSAAMVEQLERKCRAAGITNLTVLRLDLTHEDWMPEQPLDLIYSSMTLHHIPDPAVLLGRLASMLSPGGQLCLVDLDTEDGSFHQGHEGACHQGFDRDRIRSMLHDAGLEAVEVHTAHHLEKPDFTGKPRSYTLFFASGRRSG